MDSVADEKLKQGLQALLSALPKEKVVQCHVCKAQVGYGDTDAGLVRVIAIADNAEDLARYEQLIKRGMASASTEFGLQAAVERRIDGVEGKASLVATRPVTLEEVLAAGR